MNLIHSNGNHSASSLQDFFTRKKKLTEQAASAGNAGNSLVSQPRFDAPLDSVDIKAKKSIVSEKSKEQFGSLLEGLNQAYSEDKDPKADNDPKAEKEPGKGEEAKKTFKKKTVEATPTKKLSKFVKDKPETEEISKPKFPLKKPSLELIKK